MGVEQEAEAAFAALEQIIAIPHGPAREVALASAMAAPGELGRLTRHYLLTVAEISGRVA